MDAEEIAMGRTIANVAKRPFRLVAEVIYLFICFF
jgi:hypothetical protein